VFIIIIIIVVVFVVAVGCGGGGGGGSVVVVVVVVVVAAARTIGCDSTHFKYYRHAGNFIIGKKSKLRIGLLQHVQIRLGLLL
jgi:hypothetical protein